MVVTVVMVMKNLLISHDYRKPILLTQSPTMTQAATSGAEK